MPRLPLLGLLLLCSVAVAANWPQFRGNPQSTGDGPAKLPDELNELWIFKCKDSIEGAPAIVGDRVFVASTDKHLYCLDLANGREIWKKKLGIFKSSPAVKNGKVFIGDVGGDIFCVDAKTGDQIWKHVPTVGGEIVSGCNFHGDNILFAAQGMPVLCLNPKGEKVWEFEIDGGSNGCPTVAGDTVFASGCDSAFHAIDAKTGKELWSVELTGQAAATAATDGDFAYIGTVTNQVIAIDLKTKKKAWIFEPATKSQAFYSSAALSEKLAVIGSRDRKLYAIDKATGEKVWSFVSEGSIDGSPVIVGDRVYIGCLSLTGEFFVLDLKTGKKIQELTLDSSVAGSPAVAGDRVLIGTEKGSLYCFGK